MPTPRLPADSQAAVDRLTARIENLERRIRTTAAAAGGGCCPTHVCTTHSGTVEASTSETTSLVLPNDSSELAFAIVFANFTILPGTGATHAWRIGWTGASYYPTYLSILLDYVSYSGGGQLRWPGVSLPNTFCSTFSLVVPVGGGSATLEIANSDAANGTLIARLDALIVPNADATFCLFEANEDV